MNVQQWWRLLASEDRIWLQGNAFQPVPAGILARLAQAGVQLHRPDNRLAEDEWWWIADHG